MRLKPDSGHPGRITLRQKTLEVRDSNIVPRVNYAVAYEVSLFSGVVWAVERF